ncbi:MAG: hypothetical protein E4H19_10235 [Chromatiales bacterium]|nr:MAG: hypothetical protein E4H19_10235 [Chromatiales bacterium]
MTGVAGWLRKSRWARIGAIVITFLLPLTNVLSAAILVMAARGAGWRSAAVDAGASLVLLAGLVQLTSEAGTAAPGPAVLGAGALWGGALLAGVVLRRYRSVDLAVQLVVVITLLGLALASVLIPDSRAYWQPILEALIKTAGLPQVGGLPDGWLATVAGLMHGVIGASLLSTVILAVMLGLWLDREVADGDWRRQFLELRLGRVLSAGVVVATVVVFAGFPSLGGGALLVLGTGFMAQGLAIVHWTADHRAWPGIWPLALYAPVLLGAPPAGLLLLALAIAGLVDNGFSLRRRRTNVV